MSRRQRQHDLERKSRCETALAVVRRNRALTNRALATLATSLVVLDQQGRVDKKFRSSTLSYRDTEDIAFAVRNDFDFIAVPMWPAANATDDAGAAQALADAANSVRNLPGVREQRIKVFFKVGSSRDIALLDVALGACDGVLLCRSLLSCVVPIEQVATHQKRVAALCNMVGKPVVVMHHVLVSMEHQVGRRAGARVSVR